MNDLPTGPIYYENKIRIVGLTSNRNCMQASRNSLILALGNPDWKNRTPALATSAVPPVCYRRRAILWS